MINLESFFFMMIRTYKALFFGIFLIFSLADVMGSEAKSSNSRTKPYPLTTCIVTENDLNSMGGAITRVYEGQEVKFCCRPCIRKFEANPSRYLARLPSATKS